MANVNDNAYIAGIHCKWPIRHALTDLGEFTAFNYLVISVAISKSLVHDVQTAEITQLEEISILLNICHLIGINVFP